MARLIIRYPNNTIKEVEFDQTNYKIGFDEDNDLKLDNDEVTPHQAEIDTVDGAYSIVDVSDNNSTSVNGKKIDRVNLNYGDRISFGPVVGLFYPSKTGGVSDKTKVVLYIISGGLVIFLSFFLIFYFTSRRLSTVVTQEIGETIIPNTAGEYGEEARQRKLFGRNREQGPGDEELVTSVPSSDTSAGAVPEQTGEKPAEETGTRVKRFDTGNLFYKEELSLPDASPEAVKNREAVAIPRGIRRLFFRKIPVPVEVETAPVIEDRGTLEPKMEVMRQPLGEKEKSSGEPADLRKENEGSGRPVTEIPPPQEQSSGAEDLKVEPDTGTAGEQEFLGETAESETPAADEGLLSRFTGVFAKLFRANKGQQPAPFEEQPEGGFLPQESGVPYQEEGETSGASGESPASTTTSTEIRQLTEPQIPAAPVGKPENRISGFEEEPVYSEREIQQFKEKNVLSQIPVSESADLNINTVWAYPEVQEPGHPYFRSGTVGKIDGDKYADFLFGTKDGLLIAVSGKTGAEILRRNFEKPFYEPVLLDLNRDKTDDIVLVFEDGEIMTYSLKMERIWIYKGDERITSLPLFIDVNKDGTKDIVFSTFGMDIVAIDGSSGFEIWRFFDAESEIMYSPVGVDINDDAVADVVFSTLNGFLYAIDGKTGWGLWKKSIYGRPSGSVAIGDLDGDNKKDIVSLAQNGILTGYTSDGRMLFSQELGSVYMTAPSVGDVDGDRKDEIIIADESGTVKSIEGKTRREEWSFSTEEGATLGRIALADVAADRGMNVLFTTQSGLLFVLDGRSGEQIALYNYRGHVFATPIVFDLNGDRVPDIVSGSYEGSIVALNVAGSKKNLFPFMGTFWPSTNHDVKNSGYASEHLLKKLFGLSR